MFNLTKDDLKSIANKAGYIFVFIALTFVVIAVLSLIVGLWIWTFDVDIKSWTFGKLFLSSLCTAIVSIVIAIGCLQVEEEIK